MEAERFGRALKARPATNLGDALFSAIRQRVLGLLVTAPR
jgi:hypothetical protein